MLNPEGLAPFLFLDPIQRLVRTQHECITVDGGACHVLAAKRVLVSARKGVRTPMTVSAGLVMHEESGNFTPAAEKILCGGSNPMGTPTKRDIRFHDL